MTAVLTKPPKTMAEPPPIDSFEGAKQHFEAVPWCATILRSPDIVTFNPPCRSPPDPAGLSISKDQLFRHTLNRADAVPACLGFYSRPSEAPAEPGASKPKASRLLLDSATLLFDLQPGVNGFQGWTHGGLLALLVDEAMGSYIYITYRLQAEEKLRGRLPPDVMDLAEVNTVTAGMDMKLKKPLPTPAIVLVKATLVEISGRKMLVRTTIEGETGVQYAVCDGTWVALPRERL
ncbi:hypothetical protein ACJZ2D_008151 [Fusarium nematophilum]